MGYDLDGVIKSNFKEPVVVCHDIVFPYRHPVGSDRNANSTAIFDVTSRAGLAPYLLSPDS